MVISKTRRSRPSWSTIRFCTRMRFGRPSPDPRRSPSRRDLHPAPLRPGRRRRTISRARSTSYANPHLVKFAEVLLEKVDKGDFVAGVVGQNIVLEGMAFTVFELLHAAQPSR